jgi:hypothetical protein
MLQNDDAQMSPALSAHLLSSERHWRLLLSFQRQAVHSDSTSTGFSQ